MIMVFSVDSGEYTCLSNHGARRCTSKESVLGFIAEELEREEHAQADV